ncbi:Eukaryotic translation initiation factor 5A-3 [Striga hermonthica]|uniref:Eukaryotic translation initiation factor 5A-3 n=1 Tax=Striga hermonthica TaxID=68872 RepID=A0A9N7N8A8_STRHE|nr:Eukaryotic translation initiation factor 5A-3 [Striga hermonthica]
MFTPLSPAAHTLSIGASVFASCDRISENQAYEGAFVDDGSSSSDGVLIRAPTIKHYRRGYTLRPEKTGLKTNFQDNLGSSSDLNISYEAVYGCDCGCRQVSQHASCLKIGKHGHTKCHFVAIDIFNGKKLEDIVPSSHNCDVPHVNRTDYQLIDISEDGFFKVCVSRVYLLTENGDTKDDMRLPTDENLLGQGAIFFCLKFRRSQALVFCI